MRYLTPSQLHKYLTHLKEVYKSRIMDQIVSHRFELALVCNKRKQISYTNM